MINVILCGGSGTRLWPISRKLYPKQFLKLIDNRSLFQNTVLRNLSISDKILIITNEEHFFIAKDQIDELDIDKEIEFILEPVGKNTAPAITLAALNEKNDLLFVTPADHVIEADKDYYDSLEKAKELALENYLLTFGITPKEPHTGYGYIEASGYDVIKFHEKPDLNTAEKYLKNNRSAINASQSTKYYWNSGMFMFKSSVLIDEMQKRSPALFEKTENAFENRTTENINNIKIVRFKKEDMEKVPEDSIDCALFEKSSNIKIISTPIKWNDLGSFDSLYEELPKDENNNTKNANAISINSKNNLISGNKRIISTIDIEDLIIVDTDDALLITKRGSSQKVKKIVETLKTHHSSLITYHSTVHRPWGTYTVLEENDRYKIKKITVKSNKRLSLQKHFHRSEHWVVVSGIAKVTKGNEEFLVRPNESTFIPIGEIHRLENPGKFDLVMIEVQVGEYVGEDDIIRIDDDFKRKKNG